MAEKKTERKNPSSSKERRLDVYPHPKVHQLIIADSHISMISKSEKAANILNDYYTALPDIKRQQLFRVFDKMTPEQIHPKKFKKGYLSKHDY